MQHKEDFLVAYIFIQQHYLRSVPNFVLAGSCFIGGESILVSYLSFSTFLSFYESGAIMQLLPSSLPLKLMLPLSLTRAKLVRVSSLSHLLSTPLALHNSFRANQNLDEDGIFISRKLIDHETPTHQHVAHAYFSLGC